jgi:hypothetical protein
MKLVAIRVRGHRLVDAAATIAHVAAPIVRTASGEESESQV